MGFFGRSKKTSKGQADEYFTKGQWSQALAEYEKVLVGDPDNLKIIRRVADIKVKLGQKDGAIELYRRAADTYANTGFLMQAISIYKILLRLDPQAENIGDKLTEIYAKRGFGAPASRQKEQTEETKLPEIPLFSDLDPEAFNQLVKRLVPRTLAKDETLFREGDPGDSIFIITSGSVKVWRGKNILATLTEGAFFGEGAFFSQKPRNAAVSANIDSEFLEIRRNDLEELMSKHSGVAEALMTFYRRRILDGVLAENTIFGQLENDVRKKIADQFTLVRVKANEIIVREGETDRNFYLIKQGSFEVSSTPPGGGEPIILAELGAGDFFGEIALIGDTPRTATVSSKCEGELLNSEAEAMEGLMKDYPQILAALQNSRKERAENAVATFLRDRT